MTGSRAALGLLIAALVTGVIGLGVFATGDAHPVVPPAASAMLVAQVTPAAPSPTQSSSPRGPDGKPRPNATQLAELTQIIEYYGDNTPEPPFVGELNGFTFGPSSPEAGACAQGVGPDSLEFVPNDQAESVFEASDLYFDVTYAPEGYYPMPTSSVVGSHGLRASALSVTKCHGVVISVRRTWVSASGAPLEITRSNGSSNFFTRLARKELETATINGRPAIIIKPRFPGSAGDCHA